MADYIQISLEDMDAFMEAQGFDRLGRDEMRELYQKDGQAWVEAGEYIYEQDYDLSQSHAPGCRIRIYSSITISGNKGRSVGSDAIRVVLVDSEGQPFFKRFKRVHRVKGWRQNLLSRYEPVLEAPEAYPWHMEVA